MNNKSLDVPTWFAVSQSDTAAEARACRGFDVWAAGDVKWTDTEGFTQAHTFAAPFPVRVTGHIRNIWSTGTTVTSPSTNLIGLH